MICWSVNMVELTLKKPSKQVLQAAKASSYLGSRPSSPHL